MLLSVLGGFFFTCRCCFEGSHWCCISPKQCVGVNREKFRVGLIFSCPSKSIISHSCDRVSGFRQVCPAWCSSQLGSLFTTAASPAHPPPLHPEAHDQKHQKSSANEGSPAAPCCTRATLAALPANCGLKMLNKGQLQDTFSDPDPGKVSLEFTQLEPVVIPVRLLPLQDSQSLVGGKGILGASLESFRGCSL